MQQTAATDSPLVAGAGLPLALGGSVLLHLGLLFGLSASAPTPPGTSSPLSVYLVAATQAATQPPAPAVAQPSPEQPHRHHRPNKSPVLLAQATMPAASAAAQAAPHAAATQVPADEKRTGNSANTYYDGAQLDIPPHLLGEVKQVYPPRARAADIEGSVTLSLLINEHGKVDKVSVLNAQPPGYFENAALDMLRNQRFAPAVLHNQPVKSRWRTIVRYQLQS
jgi:periplasmic protein TonB